MNEINTMITTDYADLISNVEVTKTINNDIENINNTCLLEIPSITSYMNGKFYFLFNFHFSFCYYHFIILNYE